MPFFKSSKSFWLSFSIQLLGSTKPLGTSDGLFKLVKLMNNNNYSTRFYRLIEL